MAKTRKSKRMRRQTMGGAAYPNDTRYNELSLKEVIQYLSRKVSIHSGDVILKHRFAILLKINDIEHIKLVDLLIDCLKNNKHDIPDYDKLGFELKMSGEEYKNIVEKINHAGGHLKINKHLTEPIDYQSNNIRLFKPEELKKRRINNEILREQANGNMNSKRSRYHYAKNFSNQNRPPSPNAKRNKTLHGLNKLSATRNRWSFNPFKR
jgi:hypothetical protein